MVPNDDVLTRCLLPFLTSLLRSTSYMIRQLVPICQFLVDFPSQPTTTFNSSGKQSNSMDDEAASLSEEGSSTRHPKIAGEDLGPFNLEAKKLEVGWCLLGFRIVSYCFSDLDDISIGMESSLIAEERRQRLN